MQFFNINLTNSCRKTTIGYSPIIREIPTQKNTIYTALKLIERQIEAVGGLPPITTLDLQLYIIAQEIRFANWEELGHHIIRLGGFHVNEQVWKILGKKYAALGLEEILVEANVFGPNAASVIMNGGNLKRCIMAHRLTYETICRLELKSFLAWSVEKRFIGKDDESQLENNCKRMRQTMKEFLPQDKKSIDKQMAISSALADLNTSVINLEDKCQQFLSDGKAQSDTFSFGMNI